MVETHLPNRECKNGLLGQALLIVGPFVSNVKPDSKMKDNHYFFLIGSFYILCLYNIVHCIQLWI